MTRAPRAALIITLALLSAACTAQADDDPIASDQGSTAIATGTATAATSNPDEDPQVINARRSAESYLALAGFSRAGLIKQLEFEQYSTEAATAAVDSLNVDWFAEAVQSAESYLEISGFSHGGLVDQLEFEGYTPEEAEHGATIAES
jgi:hypothetical protein